MKNAIHFMQKKPGMLLIGAALLAALLSSASVQETPKLLFKAGFDRGLDADQAIGKSQATLGGAPTRVDGKKGKGVLIDEGDVLSYETEGNFCLTQGTIAFWFKPKVSFENREYWDRLFDTMAGPGNRNGIRILFTKGKPTLYAVIESARQSTSSSIISVKDWAPGEWRHVALAWSGKGIFLYLDGKIVATAIPDSPSFTPETNDLYFYLGNMKEKRGAARGVFDEVMIYDGPISPESMATLAELSSEKREETLRFNRGQISSISGQTKVPLLSFARKGPLGEIPVRSSDEFPLSDQKNLGRWKLDPSFCDEFNAPTIDAAKWDNDVDDWGTWEWEPGNTRQENGLLKISMRYTNLGKGKFYSSGIYRSREAVRYGYFEIRMRGSTVNPGTCPAFWLYKIDSDKWTEIDWLELGEHYEDRGYNKPENVIDGTLHLFKHPDFYNRELAKGKVESHYAHRAVQYEAPFDLSSGFHVFGGEWTPTRIRWYLDGVLLADRTNDYWDQPLWVTLSMAVRSPFNSKPDPDPFPAEWQIDYVRVWKAP
ncbi:MAG: laminin G domain-containing protein [Spirochaetia bacterium]|nr:laminin G domain-containing protein [Spirochaetia bacterium]